MEIIQFHEGCGNFEGCFGPTGNFITIFGTGWEYVILYSIYSIIFGGFFFGILFTSMEKDKRKTPILLKMIILTIIASVLFLFFLAYFFPASVLY